MFGKPLNQRPGYKEQSSSPLGRDLGFLAQKHGLKGVVLISFGMDRVAANCSGVTDGWLTGMTGLADRILCSIDGGDLLPAGKSAEYRTDNSDGKAI